MGIGKDIQQNKFRNEYQKAAINLIFSSGFLQERIKDFLEPFDITEQQFNILRILRGNNCCPLSTLQIRERMLDKMSDTSRMVDRLIKKELVEKKPCSADKRLVDVTISTKGLELLATIDEKEEEFDSFLNNLTLEEAHTLNNLLDKMREPKPISGEAFTKNIN
ncbi:MarR family winged helix-turn-helix transcriptional regulator [Chitinophagaceae bacterium LWZ2-11]